jgi:hypothetical protein
VSSDPASVVEDPSAPSPRFALDTMVRAGRAGNAGIYRLLSVTGDTLKIELDTYLSGADLTGDAYSSWFQLMNADQKILVAAYAMSDGDHVVIGHGDAPQGDKMELMSPRAPRDRWTHVSVDVGFDSVVGHVRIAFDGVTMLDKSSVPTAMQSGAPAEGVIVFIGMYTVATLISALPAGHARFDNIQVY